MKVLVACEYSGVVRDAFSKLGHYAVSCDLLETESPGMHYRGLVEDVLHQDWDLLIAHPPCTHLAVSGARHFPAKIADGRQQAALDFVRLLMDCKIKKKCIENPISIISTKIRKPDQIIHPWMFGHGYTKATCLWLEGLQPLVPTNIVDGRSDYIHKLPPSADRWKLRSKTPEGIAHAMAQQWGT